MEETSDGGEDLVFLGSKVRLEDRTERSGDHEQPHARRPTLGLAPNLGARVKKALDEIVVENVLLPELCEDRVDGGGAPLEAREDALLLVADMQRHRFAKVPLDASAGIVDVDRRSLPVSDGDREIGEGANTSVTLEEGVDEVTALGARPQANRREQHQLLLPDATIAGGDAIERVRPSMRKLSLQNVMS